MSDILASLVQVSFAPLMKPSPATSESSNQAEIEIDPTEDKFVMTEDLFKRLSADQERYRKELTRLTHKSYQPTVVRNLIVLQGSAKGTKKSGGMKDAVKPAPKWFYKKISEMLTGR